MGYNIDNWKTKKLNNLTIPLEAFFRHPRTDWHPKQSLRGTQDLTLECGCGQEIKGTLNGENIVVTEFDMHGEGSGTFYHMILEPAFKESKGELEAVLVWEGGDTIQKLRVKNGAVITTNIEL